MSNWAWSKLLSANEITGFLNQLDLKKKSRNQFGFWHEKSRNQFCFWHVGIGSRNTKDDL